MTEKSTPHRYRVWRRWQDDGSQDHGVLLQELLETMSPHQATQHALSLALTEVVEMNWHEWAWDDGAKFAGEIRAKADPRDVAWSEGVRGVLAAFVAQFVPDRTREAHELITASLNAFTVAPSMDARWITPEAFERQVELLIEALVEVGPGYQTVQIRP